MSLNQVYTMMCVLEETSSVNEKIKTLSKYLENPLFRKVVQYAYNQGQTYNVNDVQYVDGVSSHLGEEAIFDQLDYMHKKGGASKQDKEKLNSYCSIDKETVEVVKRIVSKDLRCGISHKTIEKAKRGTIETVPYQRCSNEKLIDRVMYPAVAQKKADSMFSYGFAWKEKDIFTTRSGNNFNLLGHLHGSLRQLLGEEKLVTVGELQVLDEKYEHVLDRKTGNGYLNTFIQGTGDPEIAPRVIYDIWDLIPYENYLKKFCPQPYSVRFPKLIDLVNAYLNKYCGGELGPIGIIPYEIVNSEAEAREFYRKMREDKFEGAILKDFSELWKDGTSRKFIKLKNRVEAEFEIVDAYYGDKGKAWEHVLGGLTVKSCDGKIVTNVGTGLSDKDRNLGVDWWKDHIGDIVTISFESVIEDKTNRETMKLYTPSFVEPRFNEKLEADTLEYCIDKCK